MLEMTQTSSRVGGDVTIAAGGVLTGTGGSGTSGNGAIGTINGSLINNGTLNPGVAGSPNNTALNVDGNAATCSPASDCSAGLDNSLALLADVANPQIP